MEQSQRRQSLEIHKAFDGITRTVDIQVTVTRPAERNVVPFSGIVSVAFSQNDERQLPASLSFRKATINAVGEQYTLVRLSGVEDYDKHKIFDELDKELSVHNVPSISELNDGSWEIVVFKLYCPALKDKLSRIFPSSMFDPSYDPVQPSVGDVEYYGYDTARALNMHWFLKRARRMVEDSWFTAAAYYSYLVERKAREEGARVRCCL